MPAVLEDVKQKKDELVRLIGNYLNNHYSEWYRYADRVVINFVMVLAFFSNGIPLID